MELPTAMRRSSSHHGHRKDPQMRKRPLTVALVAIPTLLIGGVAYAAAQSVSDSPDSQVIIPATTAPSSSVATTRSHATTPSTVDDHGGNRAPGVTDDTATSPSTIDDHG